MNDWKTQRSLKDREPTRTGTRRDPFNSAQGHSEFGLGYLASTNNPKEVDTNKSN